ncbi:tetraacyldisaccharide 4'-kinase [Endozoicomonas euniceicola]|uniref:Tetraacyldisaccharide 4'-kinase n=1 Tax=Endozoicomonas euniceicola TaxID=1234143 RepID=A0ABY6GXG9_9GAMM|nr:tetraacyldisaccharide 4'-kinase [Endozoicomonas euniceicola]UYM16654.1 tetraacyldisaccharide 4'-kinase [Endozoicomonas euniceicola]
MSSNKMSTVSSKTSAKSWRDRFSDSVLNCWYGSGRWSLLLLPLTVLFKSLAHRRYWKIIRSDRWQPPVPVVVVGNLSVGGTGKTPVVAALVRSLQAKGYRPGIASRGFRAGAQNLPLQVTSDTNPAIAGDEPVMLAQQLRIPVVVDPDRVSAAKALIENCGCDLIITDDGLQHYRLQRHVEIVVIDGQRMLGNGLCLPAGPLREPPERLQTVDQVLVNGRPTSDLPVDFDCIYMEAGDLVPVGCSDCTPPEAGTVHAVAGIGNPERFFHTLESLGFSVIPHAFPDHHPFAPDDIVFHDNLPVLMTAKDAVKCRSFAGSNAWYLPVQAHIPEAVLNKIIQLVETKGPDCVSNQSHG